LAFRTASSRSPRQADAGESLREVFPAASASSLLSVIGIEE
jgi:hypothetical protein